MGAKDRRQYGTAEFRARYEAAQPQHHRRRKVTPEMAQAIRYQRSLGAGLACIAERHGISKDTVLRVLRDNSEGE